VNSTKSVFSFHGCNVTIMCTFVHIYCWIQMKIYSLLLHSLL
jgi:hypothetical protein